MSYLVHELAATELKAVLDNQMAALAKAVQRITYQILTPLQVSHWSCNLVPPILHHCSTLVHSRACGYSRAALRYSCLACLGRARMALSKL